MELFSLENKNPVEFEGRFFVKIASNIITQSYLVPGINDNVDFALVARAYAFWLADKPRLGSRLTASGGGIFNRSGSSSSGSSDRSS